MCQCERSKSAVAGLVDSVGPINFISRVFSTRHVRSTCSLRALSASSLVVVAHFRCNTHIFASSLHLLSVVDRRAPARLACVNRRFRTLALHLPSLWSTLSSMDSLNLNRKRLSRCGGVKLNAEIWCTKDGLDRVSTTSQPIGKDRTRKLFSLVLANCSRLRHLSIHLKFKELNSLHFLSRISTAYTNISFPSLETLSLQFHQFPDTHPQIHFYTSWDLPSLCHIESHSIIPVLSDKRAAQLLSCKLEFAGTPRSLWQISTAMMPLLASFRALKKLEVICSDANTLGWPFDPDYPDFKMPHLVSLSITTCTFSDSIAPKIIKALGKCKKLTTLKLETSLKETENEAGGWLSHIGLFGSSRFGDYTNCRKGIVRKIQFPAIEDLTIVIRHHPEAPNSGLWGRNLTFDDAFAQLKNLKHLKLEGDRFANVLRLSREFPKLESLRLQNMKLEADALNSIIASRQNPDRFKSFTLVDCRRPYDEYFNFNHLGPKWEDKNVTWNHTWCDKH